ncbi:Protein ACCELERATED CELL DEATH 6 [Quillaja saponaria]|uniref:Protein ACCELERATED CELL DEATH 6 n=1 Tax=Quillaja saponaria TaxID=32244 RepID=A0AAD7QHL5_QUISA|nr:Protein ACCELERATED CELL DEATH 6 [Quillaja saponaria]
MDHLNIPIDTSNGSWRERCNQRIQNLKANDHSSIPNSSVERQANKHMIPELYDAIKEGDVDHFVDALERVLQEKKLHLIAISDQVTPAENSMLHLAIIFESEDIAELLAHHFPVLLNSRNINGDTALHVTARNHRSNSNLIEIVLFHYEKYSKETRDDSQNQGLPITRIKNELGNTALHEAVMIRGNLIQVSSLFAADPEVVHYQNEAGKSPLYLAVDIDKEFLEVLLQVSFKNIIEEPLQQGNSPLHAAILQGARIEQKRPDLFVNTWRGTKRIAHQLLRDRKDLTPPSKDLMEVILEKRPELMYSKDEKGCNALHFAAWIGYLKGVRILLEKDSQSALERNSKGHLPIHLACRHRLGVVKAFLQQEWFDPIELLNKEGQNILHIAAKKGNNNVVKYILRNKKLESLLNQKDRKGNTPLHLATKSIYPKTVVLLTQDKRVEVNHLNNQQLTPYDVALLHPNIPRTIRESTTCIILHSAGSFLTKKGYELLRQKWHRRRLRVEWFKDKVSTLLLVSILVATVTFAAGFTVPGGFNSSGSDDHGTAILVNRKMFQTFIICDTVAMYSSIIGTFILLFAQLNDFNLGLRAFYLALNWVVGALVTMSVAFMAAIYLIVRNTTWLANVILVVGIFFLSSFLIGFLPFFLRRPFGYHSLLLKHVWYFLIKTFILLFGGGYGKMIYDMEDSDSGRDSDDMQKNSVSK